MGMVGVDKIGEIRRAYFEQDRSIKEIVRTLSVSRATVRKVIRGHKTEFKYARGVQPTPKLGEWVEVLTEIPEKEAKLPKRERRSTQRLFEEVRVLFSGFLCDDARVLPNVQSGYEDRRLGRYFGRDGLFNVPLI